MAFFILILVTGCSSGQSTPPSFSGRRIVSVWYPDFDLTRAAQSLQSAADILTEISPVWYVLDNDGAILPLEMANDQGVISAVKSRGTRLIPSILNFGDGAFQSASVVAIAKDPVRRLAHARAVAKLVKDYGYDGIELDYEGLPSSAASDFTALVNAVRDALPEGKILSIAVHAKHSPDQNWPGPGAQDWLSLLRSVDRFRIMLYDYHWSTSNPGPVSPLDWMEKVLDYGVKQAALAGVSPQKIVAGLPFYGYDWGPTLPAKEASYAKVSALRQDPSNQILSETRDSLSGEPVLRYRRDGVDHTVYYQDLASLQGRLGLLERKFPQIGGIAFWRMGAEDPRVWEAIRAYSN